MSTSYSNNLLAAAHAVGAALDSIELTENVAGLADAVNQTLDRLNGLNDASRHITSYLEALVRAAKKELDLGGA
jgi:hypothetical protein